MIQTLIGLDILYGDYPEKSLDENQSRLINMYLEPGQARSKGKYKIVAYSMPGLGLLGDTSQANIRYMTVYNGTVYLVSGAKFGYMLSDGSFTQIGTDLNTSSGFAKITMITGGSDGNNQATIIDGTNGYSFNFDTSVVTFPITDTDFPQTAIDMTAQDEYVLVAGNTSIQYNYSNISDSTAWETLDFQSKISYPDNLAGVESYKKRILIYGNATTEVVYNSGDANAPFTPLSNLLFGYGLVGAQAKTTCDDMHYALLKSSTGNYGIYEIDTQFVPKAISDTPRETQLNNMDTLSDCIAYGYKRDGHSFIDWVFPTENVTLTYDKTTGIWITRQSGSSGRFLGNCSCFCYNKSLIGDYNSGKVYYQDNSLYTENGTSITRQIVSPPLYYNGRRIWINRLQIDVETGIGSNKTFTLEVSNDSGRTWTTIDTYTVPDDNTSQIYIPGLGSAYDWVFRITTTMNANFALLGMSADLEIGEN